MGQPDGLTASFDQMSTTVENQAAVVATYYTKLVAGGVPPNVAEKLTEEFNRALWSGIDAANKKG